MEQIQPLRTTLDDRNYMTVAKKDAYALVDFVGVEMGVDLLLRVYPPDEVSPLPPRS